MRQALLKVNYKKFLISFLTSLFLPIATIAAPHPATSSSALTNPENGLYLQHRGFTLKTTGSTWVPFEQDAPGAADSLRFASKDKNATGTLSVRTESVGKNATLTSYNRKWAREFSSYGFEVLSSKEFSLNNQPALVVDLVSRSKGKQIRQVIFKKDEKIAILTCSDNRNFFEKSLHECNKLIRNFRWL